MRLALLILAAALLDATPTLAQPTGYVVYQQSSASYSIVGSGGTYGDNFGIFSPFDTSLGTLSFAAFSFSTSGRLSGSVTNSASTLNYFFSYVNLTYTLYNLPVGSPISHVDSGILYNSIAPNTTLDIANENPPATIGGYSTQTVIFYGSDLSAFEAGTFSPSFSVTSLEYLQPDISADVTAKNDVGLDLAYVYTLPTTTTVTPEPSSIVLLGSGLLSVAGLVRRRLSQRT